MTAKVRRDELSMSDRGRWLVYTATTTLAFDLRTGSVQTADETSKWQRLRGDRGLRLKAIDMLRVGEPARWLMYRPGDGVRGALHAFISDPVTDIISAWETPGPPLPAGLSFLGQAFTEETMCDQLGVEPSVLDAMVSDLQVFRVTTADGRTIFPGLQVTADGTLIAGLPAVLGQLADGTDDEWTWWIFFVGRPAYALGRCIWELLLDGDVETVVRAASRAAWAWRQ